MSGEARVVVVGAGLVGLGIGRRLAQAGREVLVVDKEPVVAFHQSGHNSGVVHSGIYYQPGSLKALLCRRGVGLLREFCAEHSLEFLEIGKVIVARDSSELGRLHDLEDRAERNGVPAVSRLGPNELRDLEPHVTGVAALHSPSTAIVDYAAIARAMAADIEALGGRVRLSEPVLTITQSHGRASVVTGTEQLLCGRVIICAGLQSDLVARMAGDDAAPAIVPFRGEYFRLASARAGLVRGLVYPVPDPAYPFLGVHFTPRVDGTVDIGPNAVLATSREGYRRRDVSAHDVGEMLRWPGTRRLFRAHWRAGLHEMRGSLSKRAYVDQAREYVPELRSADVVRAPAGVRAQAVDRDGSLVDDFRISHLGAVTAVRNAPSPAATSSLAIAEHVADAIADQGPG